MRTVALIVLIALLPAVTRAQEAPPSNDTPADSPPPPPLVDAPRAEEPPARSDSAPPTPPPPGYAPQGSQVPYPYSPYGAQNPEPPGPEVGLMFTETAFGMLSAAGSSLLLWYLLLKPLGSQLGGAGDSATIYNVIFVLGFSAVPMAVSQTQLSLANGSRYYYSESWPAALSGLAAQAAVIGLYYLMRPLTRDAGEAILLIGTIVGVPVVEMIVINLTKQPRWKMQGFAGGALFNVGEDGKLNAGVPLPMPMPVANASGYSMGVGFSLLNGRF